MRRTFILVLSAVGLTVCLNSFSYADVVYLRNGGFVEGLITEEKEDGIAIKVNLGTLRFSKDEIIDCVKKEFDKSRLDSYLKRAGDGFWIPNNPSDVNTVAAEINRLKESGEREAYCSIYFRLAAKYERQAEAERVPYDRSRDLVLAESCYGVAADCGSAVNVKGDGLKAEGYSSAEDLDSLAQRGMERCGSELSKGLRFPGMGRGVDIEELIDSMLKGGAEFQSKASKEYLDAARYYEDLSKMRSGDERIEYCKVAMACYLIAFKTHPDIVSRNIARGGYKRCGADVASYRPGKLM